MPYLLFFDKCLEHLIPRIGAAFPDSDSTVILRGFKEEYNNSKSEIKRYEILDKTMKYFNVAMWIKDLDNLFLYVNEALCSLILSHPIEDSLFKVDSDFEQDEMAQICIGSDMKVLKENKMMRFLEIATYNKNKPVWLDICKVPTRGPSGRISGTMGTAVDIKNIVPDEIKKKYMEAISIEIAFGVVLTGEKITSILESYTSGKKEKKL